MSNTHEDTNRNINWKKISYWTLGVLGFLLILLIIGGFILQNKLPEQLKSTIRKETKGVYELQFADMEVSLIRGSMHLDSIALTPDTGAYSKNHNAESAKNLFQLKAHSLDISGLKLLKYLFSKKLQVTSIALNNPDLIIMKMRDTIPVDSLADVSLYHQMPEFLKDAKVKILRVNELSVVNQDKGDTSRRGGQWSGLSFAMESISIDSLSHRDSTKLWFCSDIQSNSKNIHFASADGMYDFTIAELKASVKDRLVDITDFKVVPRYPEIEFSQRLGVQGDRYDMVFGKIGASDIDFKSFEESGRLRLSILNLENAELRIFNNKTLPGSSEPKTDNFPHIAIKKLAIPLTLDTLLMKNVSIYYKELSPQSGKSGTAFFTSLYGTLHNITNDSIQWKEDPWCRAKFETKFLGNAKLLVDLNLNMADKDGEFNYKGSLGPAKGKFYNQILEPMAMARIEDGNIKSINFSVNANRFGSTAEVVMLYDDLKVSVLGKDGKVVKKKGLLSFLANTFIVKNSNPRKKGEPPIEANVKFTHSPERSFFNLMWKSVFTGLKVNLGIPDL